MTDVRAGRPYIRRYSLRSRRSALDLGMVALTLILALASVWFAADWATADETCLGCHESVVDHSGAHESLRCQDCHRPAGLSGALRYATDVGRMLAVEYIISEPTDTVIPRQPDSSACARCHGAILVEGTESVSSGGTRVGHGHLVSAGLSCDRCHETGHGAGVPIRDKAIMTECLVCHDGAIAPIGCTTCHAARPSDTTSNMRVAALVSPIREASCRGCHSAALDAECVACHGGVEMPHPAGWTESGHLYPGFLNKDGCGICHEPHGDVPPAPHRSASANYGGGFCNRCHSFPSPHGASTTWKAVHGAASRGEGVSQPSCEPCHSGSFVSDCTACHSSESCVRCHAERN